MKDKLLVSFSGGETSGYMLYWILNNWQDKYEIKVVFANTGEENEETLLFVERCANLFNIEVIWVEGVFHKEHGKGTKHKIVDFKTATRDESLFRGMVEVYGISNQANPHCNRELKLAPIKSYLRSIGWKKYYTAIGIRYDEVDRINSKRKENRLVYPLITDAKMTKIKVNIWWESQPFRLELKGYQGNCKTCWKKSDKKLRRIAYESPESFNSFNILEKEFKYYIPDSRSNNKKALDSVKKHGNTFFRKHKSAQWYIENPLEAIIKDDSSNYIDQLDLFEDTESCDIFSMCGDDNND
jgi:hypothetical protein